MVELKRVKIIAVIANARAEIQRLWDELMVGEEERGAFAPLADGSFALPFSHVLLKYFSL